MDHFSETAFKRRKLMPLMTPVDRFNERINFLSPPTSSNEPFMASPSYASSTLRAMHRLP